MLARAPNQGLYQLEPLRSLEFHLPIITAPRTNDGDSPLAGSLAQCVLNQCNHFGSPSRIAGILHLDHYCHDDSYCSEVQRFIQIASSLLHELIRQGTGVHAKPPENASLERRRGTGLLKNGSQVLPKCLKDHSHLSYRWLVVVPHEGT